MNQKHWGMAMTILMVGCATARPALMETSQPGDDAMTCAAAVLAERGYEVRSGTRPELTLEGEVRLDHSPVGATREIITASVDRASTPSRLSVIAAAWEYRSAEHSLPIARQSVSEVRPSDKAVEDARMILATCGLGARVDHQTSTSRRNF